MNNNIKTNISGTLKCNIKAVFTNAAKWANVKKMDVLDGKLLVIKKIFS